MLVAQGAITTTSRDAPANKMAYMQGCVTLWSQNDAFDDISAKLHNLGVIFEIIQIWIATETCASLSPLHQLW